MTTYAIVEGSRAYEIVRGASLEAALKGVRHPTWIAANIGRYSQVPDNDSTGAELLHGATDNGDGTFTNPPPPEEEEEPI